MGDLVKIVLLCNLLGFVHSITVTTPVRSVNITEGASLNLYCSFATNAATTSLVVQWTFVEKHGGQSEQVLFYQSGTTVIGDMFKDRVHMLSNPADTFNATIAIQKVQQDDSGTYTCQVFNIPDVDGINERDITVSVQVAPSTPFCAVHGDVKFGHQVVLTCHSKRGNPPPTYTWKHLDGQVKGFQDVKQGTLVIQNISQVQFGDYECMSANGIGSSTCTIDLSGEDHAGIVAAAVIGAVLCCAVVVLVVWFIAHQMKKRKMKVSKVHKAKEMEPMTASRRLEAQQAREEGDENPSA
ncbi:V-set and immunoglobulin domain-containing protein 1-like [Engraulis encrasicolus]|uniref:V-set and immunoglobulin domain-containing protein 1-like n=1 Tax=Engraulis encrasicolus TaxID=184585 RepID=UPI002FD33F6A